MDDWYFWLRTFNLCLILNNFEIAECNVSCLVAILVQTFCLILSMVDDRFGRAMLSQTDFDNLSEVEKLRRSLADIRDELGKELDKELDASMP